MSVAENIAYGLTVAGVAAPERTRRVEAALQLVDLEGLRRPRARDAVGRAAAARRARALPRHRAVARAARRAARQSRRAPARGDGARVRALPRPHRHDDALHHARPGRGDGARRSHRGDEQRAVCCSSRRRRSSIASPPTRRWRASSAKAWWCRSTCATCRSGSLRRRGCSATACVCAAAPASASARRRRAFAPKRCAWSQRAAGGFAARVLRMTYEGGRFRLDTIVETTKQVLHLHRPEPCAFAAGDALRLDVADGWVIPTKAQ